MKIISTDCHKEIQLAKIRNRELKAILTKIQEEPPITIGVLGFPNVGKTTTANRLFATDFCYKNNYLMPYKTEFDCRTVSLQLCEGVATDFMVLDLNGLPSSANETVLKELEEQIEGIDVIIWVLDAKPPEENQHFSYLVGLQERVIFGLNKIDLVHPNDWNEYYSIPSPQQSHNIKEIQDLWQDHLRDIGFDAPNIFPYSAKYGLGLPEIFEAMIKTVPVERSWRVEALLGINMKTAFAEFLYAR